MIDLLTRQILDYQLTISSSGFAAEAPVNALQTLSTQDAAYKPTIEEDKIVSINGDYVGQEHSY
jgi:hypothetical protein